MLNKYEITEERKNVATVYVHCAYISYDDSRDSEHIQEASTRVEKMIMTVTDLYYETAFIIVANVTSISDIYFSIFFLFSCS